VRMAALSTIVSQGGADHAGAIVDCLLSAEAPRVRSACAQALADLGAPLGERLEEVKSALPEGFRVDGAVVRAS